MGEALAWFRKAGDAPLAEEAAQWKVRAALRAQDWGAVRATIEKMPLVLRQISQESQRSMAEMGAQLKAIQRDFVAEMQAASGKP